MPNHIFNHVEASKKILDGITSLDDMGNVEFDFNNIILMPDYVYSDGSLGDKERQIYGTDNWYDWSIRNWGTKWNAYSVNRKSDTVLTFETAWSHPFPVIEKLSEMFPNETFLIGYADEDIGSNLGVYKSLNGETVEEGKMKERTPLAYRFVETLTQISYSDRLIEDIDSIKNILQEDDLNEKEIRSIQSEYKELSIELSTYQDAMNGLKKDHSDLDFNKIETYFEIN